MDTQEDGSLLGAITQGLQEPEAAQSSIKRDPEETPVDEARARFVKDMQAEIRADKKYYEKVFKRIREDMEYARLGATKAWVDGDNYTVPITNRFINQAVAALYAKNPTAVAKRKKKLMSKVWDGTQETLQAAMQLVQTGMDPTGTNQQILAEAMQIKSHNMLMDRMGQTLELLFAHYTGEDYPDFKKRMKAAVRRTKTTAVSYVEVGFHRAVDADPDVTQRIGDITAKLANIEKMRADIADGETQSDDPEVEQLRTSLDTLEADKFKTVYEGVVYDFPRSMDIIPHRACTQLNGFIGADYITREYLMTPDEVKETFRKDISNNYKQYTTGKAQSADDTAGGDQEGDRNESSDPESAVKGDNKKKDTKGKACVWKVTDKKRRKVYWLCDGYPDYLKEPEAPEVSVNGFWNVFPLIFNEVEDEKEIYPPSDVHFLKHPQREYNNVRQGLREHRRANRPKYFAKSGVLEEEEKKAIESAPAHAVIEVKGIEGNMTIDQLIQPYRGVPIDPNLYETASVMKDVLFGVGSQEADLGQTNDATATQSSIAEQSRMSSLSSNIDDLNEFLSEIARASAQVMLQQLSKQTVEEIVGPGAVWPELNGEQISKELFLEVKANSTGRPNQAAELANMERILPYVLQIPGPNPKVLLSKLFELVNIDEEDMIVDGLPSITSINAMQQQQAQAATEVKPSAGGSNAPTGNPETDPASQGAKGADNAPVPGESGQGQPGYQAPTHRYDAQGRRVH